MHIDRRLLWTAVLVLGLALLGSQVDTSWAQPHQAPLRQSVNTRVPTPTDGPTSTPTATAGPCVRRVLLQEGLDGYLGATDTWIHAYMPDFPQPRDGGLKIKGGDVWSVLMRFEMAGLLPVDANVIDAELVLFVDAYQEARALDVAAYRVLRPWDEDTATWNNASSSLAWAQPGCAAVDQDRVATPDDTMPLAYRYVYQGLDVTASVRHWLQHPEQNQGWLIKGVSESTAEYYFYSSRYSQVSLRPVLRIDYALCEVTPSATPEGTLTGTPAQTPTPSTTATPTPTPQPTTRVLDALQDTFINSWAPTAENGELGYMNCRSNGEQKMLVQFDLGSYPARARVTGARVLLYTGSSGPAAGVTINVGVHALKRAWTETEATWNQATAAESWAIPGAGDPASDYDSQALSVRTIAATNQQYAWDITAAAQAWVNGGSSTSGGSSASGGWSTYAGQPNYGLIFIGQAGQSAAFPFLSSEVGTAEYRPKIEVTYIVEHPTATPTLTLIPTATSSPSLTPTRTRTPSPQALVVQVFQDTNRNGLHDGYEQGLAGAVVEVLSGAGQLLVRQTTAGAGICEFLGLGAGDYRVRERNPWGYRSSTDDEVAVRLGQTQLVVFFGDYLGQAIALPMLLVQR